MIELAVPPPLPKPVVQHAPDPPGQHAPLPRVLLGRHPRLIRQRGQFVGVREAHVAEAEEGAGEEGVVEAAGGVGAEVSPEAVFVGAEGGAEGGDGGVFGGPGGFAFLVFVGGRRGRGGRGFAGGRNGGMGRAGMMMMIRTTMATRRRRSRKSRIHESGHARPLAAADAFGSDSRRTSILQGIRGIRRRLVDGQKRFKIRIARSALRFRSEQRPPLGRRRRRLRRRADPALVRGVPPLDDPVAVPVPAVVGIPQIRPTRSARPASISILETGQPRIGRGNHRRRQEGGNVRRGRLGSGGGRRRRGRRRRPMGGLPGKMRQRRQQRRQRGEDGERRGR
mmetsp:Transcript_21462/g.43718  ORF Transcript_21462/g.43718 Transcript_21462/m.43718 type:complete len:337 (+) Transcript_21462:1257-2267(+)